MGACCESTMQRMGAGVIKSLAVETVEGAGGGAGAGAGAGAVVAAGREVHRVRMR